MSSCCKCVSQDHGGANSAILPLICLVPRDGAGPAEPGTSKTPTSRVPANNSDFQLLDDDYIKKNFKLPQRALYLDPFRKPLITFPMGGQPTHFNMARKTKINQMILDGFLDPCEAITAPSIFPYATSAAEKRKVADNDEEIIYILQLPDIETRCPVHNQTIRTPSHIKEKDSKHLSDRYALTGDCETGHKFIWHSCKKSKKENDNLPKPGGGPLNKPKPWLLSRHTDFDLMSQW